MPYPRYLIAPSDAPGTYHCVSRCVRRAFLCGKDPLTGISFEHRRAWLEARILELGQLFAVAIHAYAVMSNHLHIVLDVDPNAPAQWSDEDVACRWLALTGGPRKDERSFSQRLEQLLTQTERLDILRQRLGSLSWFMRFLKEPIARRANLEDGCSGRFWEGRFKTQVLLDDAAVLACMAYVDLNPLRAGLVDTPVQSPHTTIAQRLVDQPQFDVPLTPVAASIRTSHSMPSLGEYVHLLQWTARELHSCAGDRWSQPPLRALQRIGHRPQQWLRQVPATESLYCRAIGTVDALTRYARYIGQRWLRGMGVARLVENTTVA